jgi:hypothetical protein
VVSAALQADEVGLLTFLQFPEITESSLMDALDLSLALPFFAGAFLCNSLPHLFAGLQGRKFPTPFSRPATIGYSSAFTNMLWGIFNAIAGLVLLNSAPVSIGLNAGFVAAMLGAAGLGAYVAVHFGKVTAGGR